MSESGEADNPYRPVARETTAKGSARAESGEHVLDHVFPDVSAVVCFTRKAKEKVYADLETTLQVMEFNRIHLGARRTASLQQL